LRVRTPRRNTEELAGDAIAHRRYGRGWAERRTGTGVGDEVCAGCSCWCRGDGSRHDCRGRRGGLAGKARADRVAVCARPHFKELLAAARTGSGAVNYISPGPGTIGHLVPELLARKENLKFAHVTYKGAGQAMTDLVAGHVKMGSVTWSSALGQIRAGTVVPLAVSSARPMPEFPDVPTMKVLGYPDLVATTWFGFSAPAGVSKEIVSRLNTEIVNALGSPAIRQRLEAEGIETEKMSAEEFTGFVASEIAKWTPVARSMFDSAAAR
jgi:hypothetical protein